MTKKSDKNQPWVSNYPPLAEWLAKIGARRLSQTAVSRSDDIVRAYLEVWQVNGRQFIVEVQAGQWGWNIWTACHSRKATDTFADAEKRLGLKEVADA